MQMCGRETSRICDTCWRKSVDARAPINPECEILAGWCTPKPVEFAKLISAPGFNRFLCILAPAVYIYIYTRRRVNVNATSVIIHNSHQFRFNTLESGRETSFLQSALHREIRKVHGAPRGGIHTHTHAHTYNNIRKVWRRH